MTDSPAERFAALSEAFQALETAAAKMTEALGTEWPEHSRMARAGFMLDQALYKLSTELRHQERRELDPEFVRAGVSLFSGLPHERASARRVASMYERCERYPLEEMPSPGIEDGAK